MAKEKSCGAVIFRRNEKTFLYLILKYKAGHWDLVKGHSEGDESEKETVLRELEEETGITQAEFVPGFREKVSYFFQRQGNTVYKEVAYFLAETPEERVRLSDEHVAYRWLHYEEALNMITFENSRSVIKKAHERLAAQERA